MDRPSFTTTDGQPVTAVTAAEMREVDRVAVEAFGIGVLQMMEHAGRALAGQVLELLDGDDDADVRAAPAAEPVTVLAGNGGNGGGGRCCARHLANRGVDVSVVYDREPEALEGPAAHHHETIAAMDLPVAVGPDAVGDDSGLLVDALVGYGLEGPLRGTAAELVESAAAIDGPIVSLDVPSGLDARTGERPGVAVAPDRVLTLALPKTGLAAADAALYLADIGLPAGVYRRADVEPCAPFDAGYVVELRSDATSGANVA